jgi:hypothetical protein
METQYPTETNFIPRLYPGSSVIRNSYLESGIQNSYIERSRIHESVVNMQSIIMEKKSNEPNFMKNKNKAVEVSVSAMSYNFNDEDEEDNELFEEEEHPENAEMEDPRSSQKHISAKGYFISSEGSRHPTIIKLSE